MIIDKNKIFTVTIDGPAASGKSTTARFVAEKMNWLYLDTGAMYRALTVKVLRNQVSLDDKEKIGTIADQTTIELMPSKEGIQVLLDGDDVSGQIRTPEVDKAVGPVCEVDRVRAVMVDLQRKLAEKESVIAEGRDMGTVVFPDADMKFFMVASIKDRAIRRQKDMERQGIDVSIEDLMKDIERRDKRDSNRAISPLTRAKDAILLDTTKLNINQQVDFVINYIQQIKGNG